MHAIVARYVSETAGVPEGSLAEGPGVVAPGASKVGILGIPRPGGSPGMVGSVVDGVAPLVVLALYMPPAREPPEAEDLHRKPKGASIMLVELLLARRAAFRGNDVFAQGVGEGRREDGEAAHASESLGDRERVETGVVATRGVEVVPVRRV